MRITLTPRVGYCLDTFKMASPKNPRTAHSLGTMVSWSDEAPGDRRPLASKKEWYAATLRQRSICAWAPVAPSTLIREPSSKIIWDVNHQIGWVYCTWSRVKSWYRRTGGTEEHMQQQAQQRMEQEARDYANYIDGRVYAFVLMVRRHSGPGAPQEMPTYTVASGENHYGDDPVCNGMLAKFPLDAVDAYHNHMMVHSRYAPHN